MSNKINGIVDLDQLITKLGVAMFNGLDSFETFPRYVEDDFIFKMVQKDGCLPSTIEYALKQPVTLNNLRRIYYIEHWNVKQIYIKDVDDFNCYL